MNRNSQKNFFKRLFSSGIFLFLVGLALIWLSVNLGRESYRKYQLTEELDALKQDVESLKQDNQQLANLIEFYQDRSYLEKEVRLKLNLKQPGEKVVIVPETDKPTIDNQQEEDKEEKTKEESNWWNWWEYFFGRD